MIALSLGLLCTFIGVVFLSGCFVHVDSALFTARAAGDETKIANLRSLQSAWDKLGKMRQVLCSSPGLLILGFGLLLASYDRSWAPHYGAVATVYAVNLISLLNQRKYAKSVLSGGSYGDSQVLRVINQNIRMCFVFPVVYAVLASKT